MQVESILVFLFSKKSNTKHYRLGKRDVLHKLTHFNIAIIYNSNNNSKKVFKKRQKGCLKVKHVAMSQNMRRRGLLCLKIFITAS